MAESRSWQRKKADAGYACITWPKEWGGGGGASWQAVIFGQEEGRFDTPANPFSIGLGMCVPTVMTVGNEADKQRFVRPAVYGEEIWCQLFSEPASGSDVAASRTRAVREGDEWLINGQKVWTSGAHYSDFGLLLARTDPDVPKHKGLTMFWIDMKAPGVDVRPIHQMSGASNFNEVYFNDLRIKDAQRVGEVGAGWRTALVTLMNERLAIGGGGGASHRQVLKLASEIRTLTGIATKDNGLREKIAEWFVQAEGLKYTRYRTLTALCAAETPGPEEFDRQGRLGEPGCMAHGQHRHGTRGPVRHHQRTGDGAAVGCVPDRADECARHAHRRRHRRNPAQHHRGTGPGPAAGYPPGQRRGVQGHPERQVGPTRPAFGGPIPAPRALNQIAIDLSHCGAQCG